MRWRMVFFPRMSLRRLLVVGLLSAFGLMGVMAYSAGIVVPESRADDDLFVPDPNQMKPDACGGITVTNIVVASGGTAIGTAANDLILGTAAGERMAGRGGNDCILGGEGGTLAIFGLVIGDILCGEEGDDVLIGGPSRDDLCIGGPGNDSLLDCGYNFQDNAIIVIIPGIIEIDLTPLVCP